MTDGTANNAALFRGRENSQLSAASDLRFALLLATRCLMALTVMSATGVFSLPWSLSLQARENRLPDDRPELDRTELAQHGLHVLESRRLILVTDVPLADVKHLPPLADALFDELERQLGPLSPDNAKSDFQVTGFVIDAKERFQKAGVMPSEEFQFQHGRHLGYQFWMNNQNLDYRRRHLMLHEFVHCFLMCEHGMQDIPPLWYTEGIAEFFATHSMEVEISRSRFGILPPSPRDFEGWLPVTEIRRGLKVAHSLAPESDLNWSLEILRHPPSSSFTTNMQYAQAWSLVWLLRNHPELQPYLANFKHVRTREEFLEAERTIPADIQERLAVVWPLYLTSLVEGMDPVRSLPAIKTPPPQLLTAENPSTTVNIAADRGWQPAGIKLQTGQQIEITCSGRYAVHDQPRPWISEPQGITIDYYQSRPIGEVTAMLVSLSPTYTPQQIPVGRGLQLTATDNCELWLQINDSPASRKENSGTAEVQIQRQ